MRPGAPSDSESSAKKIMRSVGFYSAIKHLSGSIRELEQRCQKEILLLERKTKEMIELVEYPQTVFAFIID